MKFQIRDWADNLMFDGKTFKTFEDAWDFIYENVEDEETYQDIFVIEKK